MLAYVENASVAEQLKPRARWVVHHEEGNPLGDFKVASTDKLSVGFEIREADEIRAQHHYESRWTSAMLHVWQPCLADGRHVEAVADTPTRRYADTSLLRGFIAHRSAWSIILTI